MMRGVGGGDVSEPIWFPTLSFLRRVGLFPKNKVYKLYMEQEGVHIYRTIPRNQLLLRYKRQ